MAWWNQLEDNRGSRPRCVLLVDGNRKEVANRLTQLVGIPEEVVIDHSDRWMPYGKPVQREDDSWDNAPAKEARLDELANLLPCNIKRQQEIKEQLRCWWLAVNGRANMPNWDIVSTCTVKGKPGMLLVEAKAHVRELCPKSDKCSSTNPDNQAQIGRAIAEANEAFQSATKKKWRLSRDDHYQLSNRFAWSWKLVSLGIPVVLVYLGFLNAEDMKDQGKIFRSDGDWENALRSYGEGVVDNTCWGKWLDFCGVPLLPLIRGYYQSFDGNCIPECPPMD